MRAGGQDMPGGKTRAQWQQRAELIDKNMAQAKEIERLTAELANANNSFGCQTANWPGLAERIEGLKQLSHERWRDNQRLQARVEALAGVLLKCTMNHDEAHYIAQMALDTIAATEQGESDENTERD